MSWLRKKKEKRPGLLGKAKTVQQAHLTLQSYWMIYSVNRVQLWSHTHTHSGRVKQLNGCLSSTIQIQTEGDTEYIWSLVRLPHAHTHTTQINSQLCFVTPWFIFTPTGTHVHREMLPHTAKKTARLIQIRKPISLPLFELNRLAHTLIWLFVHMLNNAASMTKAWLMFLNVCINWQYLKIIPSGHLFISLTRLLITNTRVH